MVWGGDERCQVLFFGEMVQPGNLASIHRLSLDTRYFQIQLRDWRRPALPSVLYLMPFYGPV